MPQYLLRPPRHAVAVLPSFFALQCGVVSVCVVCVLCVCACAYVHACVRRTGKICAGEQSNVAVATILCHWGVIFALGTERQPTNVHFLAQLRPYNPSRARARTSSQRRIHSSRARTHAHFFAKQRIPPHVHARTHTSFAKPHILGGLLADCRRGHLDPHERLVDAQRVPNGRLPGRVRALRLWWSVFLRGGVRDDSLVSACAVWGIYTA